MSTRATARQINPREPFHFNKFSSYTPYFFIAPMVVLLATFTLYPFIFGAKLCMTDAQFINPGQWVGFANFKELFGFDEFRKSMIQTFEYMLGCFITQIPCAFILAYILNNITKRLRGVLRASFFVPVLVNTVLIALMYRLLFNKDTGAINWVMGLFGLPNHIAWTENGAFAIPLMVIVSFWQWTGYHAVYFLAQLQTIDVSIYESAKLDGASPARVLWSIITPMMRPAFTFVLVTSAIGALQLFDLPFLLFPNVSYGPGGAAETAVCFVYKYGFGYGFRQGYATAASWCLFAAIFIFSMINFRLVGMGKSGDE